VSGSADMILVQGFSITTYRREERIQEKGVSFMRVECDEGAISEYTSYIMHHLMVATKNRETEEVRMLGNC